MRHFILRILLSAGVLALSIPYAAAQSGSSATAAAAAPAAAPAPGVAEATFTYLNRPIMTMRAALLGVPPAERVRSAIQRLDSQAALGGALAVSVKPSVIGNMVQVDGATIFFVTPGDLDPLGTDTLDSATSQVLARFDKVIGELRETRDGPALWIGAGRALVATLIAFGLVRLAVWARRGLQLRLLRRTAGLIERLRIGNVTILRRERVVGVIRILLTALMIFIYSMIAYEWISVVLAQFPFTRPWGEALNGFLFDWARHGFLAVIEAIPGLATAGVIFFVARMVARGFDTFFGRVQDGELKLSWLEADLAYPTRRIATLIVWVFAVAMAYPYLPGSQTEAFKGMSVMIGLMVSLGASSLVGQAFSGLILTYGRVYRRGEYVRIGEHEGTVTNVGTFTTRIRTGMGEELTLSNATILAGTTANYSRAVSGTGNGKVFVVDVKVTIGYDVPWRQVHALLILAAHRTAGVLSEPRAQVYQTALSDWYPEYRLACHAAPGQAESRAKVLSDLHANIQDTFNEFGVQIMSPQYFEDPAEPKIVPPEKWYPAPAERPVERAAGAAAASAPDEKSAIDSRKDGDVDT